MKPEQLLRKVFPPMLATLTDEPPADRKTWSFELKYDGFRAIAAIVAGKVAMWVKWWSNLGSAASLRAQRLASRPPDRYLVKSIVRTLAGRLGLGSWV